METGKLRRKSMDRREGTPMQGNSTSPGTASQGQSWKLLSLQSLVGPTGVRERRSAEGKAVTGCTLP